MCQSEVDIFGGSDHFLDIQMVFSKMKKLWPHMLVTKSTPDQQMVST